MTTLNEHTGDSQQTKPPTDAYREGWDRIFGKIEELQRDLEEDKPL